uniref:Uncharacterized protein n=1 Tax=Anguilla anguilla TaxID=7936 RepID=A0A0E9TH08_ANGAN
MILVQRYLLRVLQNNQVL